MTTSITLDETLTCYLCAKLIWYRKQGIEIRSFQELINRCIMGGYYTDEVIVRRASANGVITRIDSQAHNPLTLGFLSTFDPQP
jgi:hypothetical protein